jgi:hypothetical protein
MSERLAWATGTGLSIATVYSRFSSKSQHSTEDQVRTCTVFAAQNKMYVPPEAVCVDEAGTDLSCYHARNDQPLN